MKFFSEEMAKATERMLAENPTIQAKLKGVTIKFILCVTDAPGKEDRQMAIGFKDGKLTDNALTIKPAPSDLRTTPVDTSKFAAKVSGPYETIAAVTQKKLPMLAALGSMRIEGDMSALITNMTGLTSLLDIFGGMPGLEY
jgi:hypothetical protein